MWKSSEQTVVHIMPNIDVHVFNSGRRVALAKARPVRVTPDGNAGVVYRGKVFPIFRIDENAYAVNTVGIHFSADQSVCRLAATLEARRLLGSASTFAPSAQKSSLAEESVDSKSRRLNVTRSLESSSTPALTEILGLLSIAVPIPEKRSERDR